MYDIKVILFDLDGTILDSLALTINAIIDTVNNFSERKLTQEEVYSHFGGPEEGIFKRIFNKRYAPEILEYYYEYNRVNLSMISIHKGIPEVLKNLNGTYPTGIYTARCRYLTDYFMDSLKITHFFNFVIAGDEVAKFKPDKEGIIKFSNICKIVPESILFVGDTERDIVCARNAGAISAFATWDSHVKERSNYNELLSKSDIILSKPSKLFEYIK